MNKLEMHQRLQPLYKKMMGDWRPKDGVYQDSFGEGFVVRVHVKRGIQKAEIYFKSVDTVMEYDITVLNDFAIRIPLPIDPVNPKRGLWGMVDWSKLRYEQWGPDGELAIFKLPYIQYNEDMGIPIKDHPFVVAEPETALLMALLEQEGL
jgi:hypothetical protein